MGARGWTRAALIGGACLGVWLAGSVDARACECTATRLACEAAPEARVVFVGRVAGRAQGDVLFDVERAMKGVRRGRIRLDSGDGDCMFSFRDGERYIVYASWDPQLKSLTTTKCSRTRLLSDRHARADLAYFDRVSPGVITGVVDDATKLEPSSFVTPPIGGAVVSASRPGDRRPRTAVTATDGTYMLKGLPRGTWTITVTLPPEFVLVRPVTVIVPKDAPCAEGNFFAKRVADAPR
jgi:hypothetical protein